MRFTWQAYDSLQPPGPAGPCGHHHDTAIQAAECGARFYLEGENPCIGRDRLMAVSEHGHRIRFSVTGMIAVDCGITPDMEGRLTLESLEAFNSPLWKKAYRP